MEPVRGVSRTTLFNQLEAVQDKSPCDSDRWDKLDQIIDSAERVPGDDLAAIKSAAPHVEARERCIGRLERWTAFGLLAATAVTMIVSPVAGLAASIGVPAFAWAIAHGANKHTERAGQLHTLPQDLDRTLADSGT